MSLYLEETKWKADKDDANHLKNTKLKGKEKEESSAAQPRANLLPSAAARYKPRNRGRSSPDTLAF